MWFWCLFGVCSVVVVFGFLCLLGCDVVVVVPVVLLIFLDFSA